MATDDDLRALGFCACLVSVKRLNIPHLDPYERGPFCRLKVEDTAPERPGVYGWTVNGAVMYVGKAGALRHIVNGARMERAYNDYTYVPASQVRRPFDPRVRVNGLLNRALNDGAEVGWWWKETESEEEAFAQEAHLRGSWRPPWNLI